MVDAHYDLIIIGTGSGNSIPGPHNEDKSIAIVESGTFGGTCLNVGCIPTKMFAHAAYVADMARHGARLGVHSTVESIDWPNIVQRVFTDRIDQIAAGGEEYRRGERTPNIDVYDGKAHFVGARTIATADGDTPKVISGEQIVIAAGARPHVLPVIADSGVPYHTSDTIMRMEQLPASLIVVGGGFIALEFAHIFADLGVDVTVINRSSTLLRNHDADISQRITELTQRKMTCHLGVDIAQVSSSDEGVTIELSDGTVVSAEELLVATGRTPNGDQLNLDAAGIAMDGARIKVDEYGRTTAEGVWALGDVSSPYQLKHVANAEARAIQHNLDHPEDLRKLPHDNVPSGVFSNPQIGSVGLTEQQARDAGYNITTKIQQYGDVAYGWAMEDQDHFAKLIACRDTGKLLGAHIIGPQATTLIQQLVTVMAFELDVREVAKQQYWVHPAMPELIENALLGLEF